MVQPEPSALAGTMSFFDRLGVFDILLPFVLVFTIVFAILEKTKVYGLEKIKTSSGTEDVSRKNLNAMTAFVVAFFVVASSQLVSFISQTLAHTVVLLVVILCFLMLIGAFHTGSKEFSLEQYKNWKYMFMIIVFIAIILIALNAAGVLGPWYYYLIAHWNSTVVSSIGLIIVIIVFMLYVTHDTTGIKKEEKKEG